MGTTLTAMLFSGGRAALAHQRLPRVPAPRWSAPPDHQGPYDRQSRLDAGLLALVLARHWTAGPDRSADMGLRDLRAGGRYLLCSDGLSPVMDDRPHFYVLTLRAVSADALASWPS